MKTKELIEWLKELRSSKYCWDEYDRKVVNKIIKRLEEYESLQEESYHQRIERDLNS